MVCNNVVHWSDQEFCRDAYHPPQQHSAPGLDQGTAQPYAEDLADNLRALQERQHPNR
jgi:hypothetical protein